MNPTYVAIAGLVFDIFGALLLAVDYFRPYRGMLVKDIGSGAINGGAHIVENPDAISHATKNRKVFLAGLILLFAGFLFQMIGALMSLKSTSCLHVN